MASDRVLPRAAVGATSSDRTNLVIAQGSDITQLDPHFATSASDVGFVFNLYDTLLRIDRDRQIRPSLATGWQIVTGTNWEFKLRPDVRFHNGEPLTADDVKFSIERTYKARTILATVFNTVERIETPDPYTVRIHTKKPDPLLPARLTSYGGQILPKRYVEDAGAEGLRARPVGTGPVRFVEWIKDDRLVLEAVPEYWGGRIDPAQIVLRPLPEVGPRVAALLRGEADIVTALPPDHADRVARHPSTKVEEILYAGLYVLVVDSRRPPLGNPLVKQALSLAIDRTAIVKDLWRARGLVPSGPIPKGESFYDDTLPPLAYDPDLARRRLAEAGYRQEPIVLESSAGHLANDRAMSEAIVAMWRDVGIAARLEILEKSVLAQKTRERSFKGLRWSAPVSPLGDPDAMMWRLLGPGGVHDNWRHARFDELGDAAQSSMDSKFRRQAYREMTAIFQEHLPWIPVIQPIDSYGLQRTVDWKPYSDQRIEIRAFNLRMRRS
jgi:peptide/nickel transport system substrate-binding protein